MKDSVKLEWLGFELGEGASLVEFARKFRELFGEKISADSQRTACLKLYRQYANIVERKDLERGAYPTVAEARNKNSTPWSAKCRRTSWRNSREFGTRTLHAVVTRTSANYQLIHHWGNTSAAPNTHMLASRSSAPM